MLPKLFLWHRALMAGTAGPRPLYLTGTETHRVLVVQDAICTEQTFTLSLIGAATALTIGLLLLVCAPLLSGFFSGGRSTPNPNENA